MNLNILRIYKMYTFYNCLLYTIYFLTLCSGLYTLNFVIKNQHLINLFIENFSVRNTVNVTYNFLHIQLMNKMYSPTKISKSLMTTFFYHNGIKYEVPIILKRGPKKYITSIRDENGIDIKDKILPLMGVNLDFYNMNIKPKDLGYTKIIFDDDKVINENDNLLF